jgi:hypothetical protein
MANRINTFKGKQRNVMESDCYKCSPNGITEILANCGDFYALKLTYHRYLLTMDAYTVSTSIFGTKRSRLLPIQFLNLIDSKTETESFDGGSTK